MTAKETAKVPEKSPEQVEEERRKLAKERKKEWREGCKREVGPELEDLKGKLKCGLEYIKAVQRQLEEEERMRQVTSGPSNLRRALPRGPFFYPCMKAWFEKADYIVKGLERHLELTCGREELALEDNEDCGYREQHQWLGEFSWAMLSSSEDEVSQLARKGCKRIDPGFEFKEGEWYQTNMTYGGIGAAQSDAGGRAAQSDAGGT
jgi:hypothetical protein